MADTNLGTRIRRARERKRWTQQDLADALSALNPEKRPVGLRTVGGWERGEAEPSMIGALEQVLGVSLGEDGGDPREEELRAALERLRGNPVMKDFGEADVERLLRAYRGEEPRAS